ncbi:NUDIX domain-containing protein [Methylomonas sp. UP202]|uniref:NUDIX hydrolase n=1 Tax=Methylomonas sp. UP202 TaxID=3040943 RepID=UPI00247939C2|nr:NUDIX domain-containing protein [Methylomonas sp. UP202]WGS88702.1 NUDIX domain-containing protein [Methylomonas sp. UP202]
MDEKQFLADYDKHQYENPLLTSDAVLFTYHEERLKVLLVKRSNHPDQGKWGLPGGFVDLERDKILEDTVVRKLKEKTGIDPPYLEQLQSIGNADRDKRGWSVTVVYTALMAYQDCETHIETVTDAQWLPLDVVNSMELAFDHQTIIGLARERMRQKALYSIVPAYALPETFTLPELQHLHEILIGKPLQKKSFRRRIEQAELLVDTGEKRSEGGRPAVLYRMKQGSGAYTFVRNLED